MCHVTLCPIGLWEGISQPLLCHKCESETGEGDLGCEAGNLRRSVPRDEGRQF